MRADRRYIDVDARAANRRAEQGTAVLQARALADPLASKRVEVAIVTFGGRVNRLVEFVTATNFEPPTLQPFGGTPMGEAITTALDMIEERKASYREHGIAYYRPWAFLITDGEPNDHWRPVVSRVQDGEKKKVILLFRRGRRRGGYEGAGGNLRSQAALAAGNEVPRTLQLAVEFAAGSVAVFARR